VTETGGHPARSLRYRAVFSKKGSFLAGFPAGCSGLDPTPANKPACCICRSFVSGDSSNSSAWAYDSDDSEAAPESSPQRPRCLYVTGPTGCGKSAAVYACAKVLQSCSLSPSQTKMCLYSVCRSFGVSVTFACVGAAFSSRPDDHSCSDGLSSM
jgi:hypothetical protein